MQNLSDPIKFDNLVFRRTRNWKIKIGYPNSVSKKRFPWAWKYVGKKFRLAGFTDFNSRSIIVSRQTFNSKNKKDLDVLLLHELTHVISGIGGHGKKFYEIFGRVCNKYLGEF